MLNKNSQNCNYEIMTLLRFFRGRVSLYGKCMDGCGNFTQNPVHKPMPLDATQPFKRRRYNYKLKVAFPRPIVPPVPLMQMALVDHLNGGGLKPLPELLRDGLAFIHGIVPLPEMDVSLYNYSMPRIKLKQNSPEFEDGKPRTAQKSCEMPGCRLHADHRAPKDRALSDYYWFCLDHVKEYNNAWNFFSGMNESEVEQHIHNSFYGDRPTWRYDMNKGGPEDFLYRKAWQTYNFTDKNPEDEDAKARNKTHQAGAQPLTPEREALSIMGLQEPVTLEEIKRRYKTLAKKHHPDLNGGCSESEELLKRVNMAYTILKLAYQKYQTIADKDA